jgi:SAM-dependent methyltransferase
MLPLGYDSVLTTEVMSDRQHIVLGSNLLPYYPIQLPADSILYNLEQISPESSWLEPPFLDLLRQFRVWDYSQNNLSQLARLDLPQLQHVPLGYVPQLTRIQQLEEQDQDIDILFYGSLNERRQQIIEALINAGIKVESASNLYGQERDHLIARSKIVLNLHYYAAQVFEVVRVSYLLANHQFVISEACPDDPDASFFEGGLIFANHEDLVCVCLAFLKLPQERKRIAKNGFNRIRQRQEASYLQAAIQELGLDNSADSISGLRVDLGCGTKKAAGFLGVDIFPAVGVDVVADLSQGFPFNDSCIAELRAYDFIEHLSDRISTMNEIWRVCKPGAQVDIFVPSTDGRGAFQDPTHVSYWNINSFMYYCVDFPDYLQLCQQYGFKGAFKILKLEQIESPNQVIHVRAILSVVKEIN